MGGGESKIVKGLDHSVGLINDDIELNKCEYLKCVPEYFRNKNKSNQLLFIVILIILLIYFILIYNMKYI